MSNEPLPHLDPKTQQRWTKAVMDQIAAGRPAAEIVQDLQGSGWTRNDATAFVADIEQRWNATAGSSQARSELYLQAWFPEMRPVRSTPSLSTVNGIGAGLYGARDHDPQTGTFVKTHCVCVLFVPLIALGAYRVSKGGGGSWYLIGKVPLSRFARGWNIALLCAAVGLLAWGGIAAYTSSDEYLASAKLAEADAAAEAGRLVEASQLYCLVTQRHTKSSRAARGRLAALAERPEVDRLSLPDAAKFFSNIAHGAPQAQGAFACGAKLVRFSAAKQPQSTVALLAAAAPLACDDACKLFGELAVGDWQKLLPADATAVYRTAVTIPQTDDQRHALAAHGIAQSRRLANEDATAAAFDVLQIVAPLTDRITRDETLQFLLGRPLDNLSCAAADEALRTAREIAGAEGETPLVDRGLRWVDDHTKADPHAALTLLNHLATIPKADKTKLDAARRKQLERIVAADPQDVDAAVQLALILERDGDAAAIEKLLTPHRAKLGAGEGARLLGQVLAAKGEFDDAYALLDPYLAERLEAFHGAEQAFVGAVEAAQQEVVNEMRRGAAAGFNYGKYEVSDDAARQAMVDTYINERLRDHAGMAEAREKLAEVGAVVPAAIDLGIVLLHRAQKLNDPAARRAELERAEKTFLAVRGVAGNNDQYMLNLGQVYYWLGKHGEGHEQFEKLLAAKNREYAILVAVAQILRELGAMPEARRLMEEAYEAAVEIQQKQRVAHLRAITWTDLDDKIAWLERCNQEEPATKSVLAEAHGEQAATQGDDATAAKHYREAVTIYESQTKTATIYNNGALALFSLFAVTGDKAVLDQGIEWIEKAVALSPSESMVLHNAAEALLEPSLQNLVGDKFNLRLLSDADDLGTIEYLITDEASQTEWRRRVKEHPGVKKSLTYFERAMVLAPKQPTLYSAPLRIYGFLDDVDGLERLAARIAAANPDVSETVAQGLKFVRFEDDETTKTALASAGSRREKTLKESRAAKGPMFAAAVEGMIDYHVSIGSLSRPEADRLVGLAEEAHAAVPSAGSTKTLRNALLLRAAARLSEEQPAYQQAIDRTQRSLSPLCAVVLALARQDAMGQAARDDADIKRAVELVAKLQTAFPKNGSYWTWALLHAVKHEQAAVVAKHLADDAAERLEWEVCRRLAPASATTACYRYWALLCDGKGPAARAPIDEVIKFGAPFPVKLMEDAGQ